MFDLEAGIFVSADAFNELVRVFPVTIAFGHFVRVLVVLAFDCGILEEGLLVVTVVSKVHGVLKGDVVEDGVGSCGGHDYSGSVVGNCLYLPYYSLRNRLLSGPLTTIALFVAVLSPAVIIPRAIIRGLARRFRSGRTSRTTIGLLVVGRSLRK